jgi:hypothetical protein
VPTEACGVPNGTHNQVGHTLHITARIERGQVLGGLISEYRSPA